MTHRNLCRTLIGTDAHDRSETDHRAAHQDIVETLCELGLNGKDHLRANRP